MGLTDILAIIGAFTGSAALFWDIYKWRHSGPKLRVSVSPNMSILPYRPNIRDDRVFLSVQVVNEGQSKTTITHLEIVSFKSKKDENKNRSDFRGVVTSPLGAKIPHVIEPGEQWGGLVERTPDMLNKAVNERLFVRIYHSLGKNPVKSRVTIGPDVLENLSEQEKEKAKLK